MTGLEQGSLELASSLERMNDFIGAYRAFRWRERQARLSRMSDFISAYQEEERQWRESRPARFNVFSMFKVGTDEVTHSAFLAWLLDPEAGHKQGNLFLVAFLDACHPEPELAIPARYRVRTECPGLLSRIDILVYQARQFVLYIENKTISPDTPDQPDREFEDMRWLGARLDVPPASQIPIYLTPEGRKPPGIHARQWRTAAYTDVGEAFDKILPLVTEDKVRFIVNDWLDTLSLFVGIWRQRTMTQFTQESILIAKNWGTVADILRASERLKTDLSNLLSSMEADLRKLEWWDRGWVFRKYSSSVYYIANEQWQLNNEYIPWIGVNYFDPAHIFGADESSPTLYVWALEAYKDLIPLLEHEMRQSGYEVDAKGCYLVTQEVQKCLPEMVEEYPGMARKQILDFIDHHAKLLMKFDGIIRQYLSDKAATQEGEG